MTAISAAVSGDHDAVGALGEAWARAEVALGGAVPDLVAVFASADHADVADALGESIAARADGASVIGGCIADGVIAGAHEYEQGPTLAVWLASLADGARVESLALRLAEGDDGEPVIEDLPDPVGADAAIVLVDPYTFPVEALVDGLAPLPVIGGLAGLGGPGRARLFTSSGAIDRGAVGVLIAGVDVQPLVSQGARPIGPELVVTAAEGNAVLGLAGQPPLDRLAAVLRALTDEERTLALEGGLMIGLVIDENRPEYTMGDFLVRGLSADRTSGALLVGDRPRVGQTVRFHVRDGASADHELRSLLGYRDGHAGALLFSCNGRGTRMFDGPDHDAGALAEAVPAGGIAGCFCQGELGPVGGRTFVHGFTATIALFR